MIDEGAIAAHLYGPKPAESGDSFLDREGPAKEPVPAPGSEEVARAERLYGEKEPAPDAPITSDPKAAETDKATGLPKSIAELRQSDGIERRMYSAQKTYERVDTESLFDPNADPESVAAAGAELREIFSDHGATQDDATAIRTLALAHPIGSVTHEQHAAWQDQAQRALIAELGPNVAPAALRDAQRLAQRDPRVVQLLNRTGLGSHPQVVKLFVKLAQEQKSRGRLR